MEAPADKTVHVRIESENLDEMVGRLIGREGRNIRTLEHLTDTNIDLPDASVIKPSRWVRVTGHPNDARLCAKAVHLLIKDGRIAPHLIEETLEALYGKNPEDLEYLKGRRNQRASLERRNG